MRSTTGLPISRISACTPVAASAFVRVGRFPFRMETVKGAAEQPLELHPQAGRASFVPRLGHAQQRLAPLLSDRGVTTTVSPLYYMAHNPELALFARRDPPLGLALDPCTHLRQLPGSERAPAFRALPFGRDEAPFDPDLHRLSDVEIARLARTPVELARSRGATLVLTAFHLTGGPSTRGRQLDLLLARAGIAFFRQQRMDEPPAGAEIPIRREVYATLAVRREALGNHADRMRLADAYLALRADGLWVKIEGFDEAAARADIRAGAAFLAALRDGGVPVVSCGPGQLHLGLLVNDISSSVGLGEGERFRFPAPRSRDWSGGRARTIYHPRYLRGYRAGIHADRAFETAACRCGNHPPRRPPNRSAIEAHAAAVRADEAAEATAGERSERREWLAATAAMASHLGHDAGVDYTQSLVFETLNAGIDEVEESRRQAS